MNTVWPAKKGPYWPGLGSSVSVLVVLGTCSGRVVPRSVVLRCRHFDER